MNASVPVIRIDASSYYALQNGVWFVATSPAGPWAVATSVPLHYVTYAYVYGATPEVVYTGYTPGYLGTVVAPGPVVVYGTGYVYPAWVGTVWYPAPVTWGWSPFDVGFGIDVFTGFAFGFALGHYWGWHHGWGWHGGGGWGWHHGIAHVNVYNRWGDHVYLSRHLAGDIRRDIGRDVRRDIGGRRFGGADVMQVATATCTVGTALATGRN